MKIKKIILQNHKDFKAIFVCEHCGHERIGWGYYDTKFHQKTITNMKCFECRKKAPKLEKESKNL